MYYVLHSPKSEQLKHMARNLSADYYPPGPQYSIYLTTDALKYVMLIPWKPAGKW